MSEPAAAAAVEWHDVLTWQLGGQGFARRELAHPFHRMPAAFAAEAPEAVWDLSRQAAGLYVDFQTDSDRIEGRWVVEGGREVGAGCGSRFAHYGLDLYGQDPDGPWQWIGAMDLPADRDWVLLHRETLIPNPARRYRVYLPGFRHVERLAIGVSAGARFTGLAPSGGKPIVFYGTSICHGHESSRPGLTHINVLNRSLDLPTVNLGFSGRGRMEVVIAEYLRRIDARLFVIDCLPNISAADARERVAPFVSTLRSTHPTTPILFVGDRLFGNHAFVAGMKTMQRSKTNAQREALAPLMAQDPHVHLIDGIDFFGDDGTDDGSHPNDLGFHRFAGHLAPIIRNILAQSI